MDHLQERLAHLSPEKIALLLRRLAPESEPGASVSVAVPRRPSAGRCPLSFAQQRLWFLDQLEPGSFAYNVPVALRIGGHLDWRALARAFREVARRHEALRTVFRAAEGTPFQVILAELSCDLAEVDLAGLAPERRQACFAELVALAARRPFDLAAGPLWRVLLLRLGPEDYVLSVTMHHIVSDGWSVDVLVRELATLYEAYEAGRTSPLSELPVQYADFAHWQRERLQGEVLERELSFWRQRLDGAPAALELPVDRPRSRVRGSRGAASAFELPAALSEALRGWSRRQGTTPFMILLAGFQLLLARHSGQWDVSVGTAVAGRNHQELEGLIGFFVNMLVLRAQIAPEGGFQALLGETRDRVIEAFAHQEVPFEKLVAELVPERDASLTPLFQVAFTFQNAAEKAAGPGGGLRIRHLRSAHSSAKFDLDLAMGDGPRGLEGRWVFNADLFEGPTIARMSEHLERLLAAAVAEPDLPCASLPLLTEVEHQQIVVEWNDTRLGLPVRGSLPGLFEEQVDRSPEAVAAEIEGRQLSYRGLDRCANQLAHHLLALGVGPDVPVAICVERSLEMLVGVLGILKAGGAYVPLDPEYPRDRLAMMIEEVGAPVLLTQEALRSALPPGGRGAGKRACLCLDSDWPKIAAWSADRPRGEISPESLIYVIFTSGSTGKPKGVMVHHEGALNLVLWANRFYPMTPADRLLLSSSFNFDFWIWACFGPLVTGARAFLALPEGHRDVDYMIREIGRQGITMVHFVPSMLQAVLAEDGLGRCSSLRKVYCGGEALSPELLDSYLGSMDADLHNQYGPTEVSVYVTERVYRQEDRSRRRSSAAVFIGRPIGNAAVYVLDRQLWPVPVGVTGELFLGGLGVSRGYWSQPGMTAAKFLPDPFAAHPGSRLYRSGDLGRWSAGGELEFFGRLDHQVKIRGFRIELGEIESLARQHPGVAEAVAMVREDQAGDKRLVLYAVATETSASNQPLTEGLRVQLSAHLPSYMVPAYVVELDMLPRTPSGKVDRLALARLKPAFDLPGSQIRRAPRTPVEELLVDIWAEVLHRESVGIDDNFFELGGHSLLATQVVSRLRSVIGVELPLRTLFQEPTLAGLARLLEMAQSGPEPSWQAPPLVPMARLGPLPLSFAQERLWFLDQLEPGTALYNMPSAFRVSGPFSVRTFASVICEIVRRHEVLRTRFRMTAGHPVQEVLPEADLLVPILDLSNLPSAERNAELHRLVAAQARRPFDLSNGPVLRASVLPLGPQEHAVLVTLHHIASDGWSMGVFVRELGALYEAFDAGRPSPLPELPVQYADFAAWQRSWLTREALDAEVEHWRRALAGAPQRLQLPTDRPRPVMASHRGGNCPFQLSPDLSSSLLTFGRQQGTTLFMTLLAGFVTLLSRYSGQEDLLVGSPIAGRNHREVEDLIGFFVNTLVLRADLGGAPSFQELLGRVRETTLAAYAHQDLPFEKLVDVLAPERDLSWTPLFQVMLTLQNAPAGELPLSRLTFSPLASGAHLAKFDLLLSLQESGRGLRGALTYASDLFDHSTVERLLEHLVHLLQGVLDAPESRLSEFTLISASERIQLLLEWNDTERRYPAADRCVHELFEAQVARSPAAVAVVFEGEELTYRELNVLANRWARHLRRLGVGPEIPVALHLERSTEMVVALLAVLKAGGVYVPLDPAWPQARLEMALEDLGAPLVLTQEMLKGVPPDSTPGDGENLESWTDPAHLAYVIFTSGSTGRPKGAMNSHRGVVNRLLWSQEIYGLTAEDRVLQKTPYSFDVSVWEFFWPLLCGAQLVVAAPGGHQDPAYLIETIVEQGISTVHFVPSMLQVFVRADGIERCTSVQRILCSGEELPLELLGLLSARLDALVHNLYGPTEAGVDVTFWACEVVPELRAVPIGRPVANTQIHLWDRDLHPVPVGVPGELCIGGVQVARGYRGRPELTAEKFVPDPFSVMPGERLYRTGDLARRRNDGQIEFLRRIDSQVKVRGIRIELGEIESLARQHPGVAEAVAMVREDQAGDKRLVLYAVATETSASNQPLTEGLRVQLSAHLPSYMVPANVVELDVLPRTASGKVDRLALPAPDSLHRGEGQGFIAPRDILELRLARIWEDSLGVTKAGARDNFFELGGHSLLAVSVVERIGRLVGRQVPVSQLFQTPQLDDLARHLRNNSLSAANPPLVRIQPDGRRPPLFWVHPVGGNVLCYAALARHLGMEQPFYAFQAPGIEGEQEPLASIEALSARYLEELLAVDPRGPYFLGGWSLGGVVAFEMARQLHLRGRDVASLCLLDSHNLARCNPETLPDHHDLVRAFAQEIALSLGLDAAGSRLLRHGRSEDLASLLEDAQQAGLVSSDFSLQRWEALFRVFRANRLAFRSYVPQPYDGRILLLRAEKQLGSASPQSRDPFLGWNGWARGGVEVHPVAGDHYTLLHEPYVRIVAQKLAETVATHAYSRRIE